MFGIENSILVEPTPQRVACPFERRVVHLAAGGSLGAGRREHRHACAKGHRHPRQHHSQHSHSRHRHSHSRRAACRTGPAAPKPCQCSSWISSTHESAAAVHAASTPMSGFEVHNVNRKHRAFVKHDNFLPILTGNVRRVACGEFASCLHSFHQIRLAQQQTAQEHLRPSLAVRNGHSGVLREVCTTTEETGVRGAADLGDLEALAENAVQVLRVCAMALIR